MNDMTTIFVPGYGGAQLAVHRVGPSAHQGGRPVLMLHGLFSSAAVNWVKYGHAAALAAAGFQAIMPDLRAHGQSAAPHDPAAYPHGVLLADVAGVVSAWGAQGFRLRERIELEGWASLRLPR